MNDTTPLNAEQEVSRFGPLRKEKKRKVLRLNIFDPVKRNLQSDFNQLVETKNEDEENKLTIVDDEATENCLNPVGPLREGDELCRLHLGDERYVVLKSFKGVMQVHIRQFEIGAKGPFPTSKGVALNLEKWKKLEEMHADDIDLSVNNFDKNDENVACKIHLGSNYYVSVKKPIARVDIRRWFLPLDSDVIVPTKKGISLTFKQWSYLKNSMTVVRQLVSKELDETVYCEQTNDHLNQMGYFACSNCNPNGYMDYVF
ncbi:hypothetical protein KUTeg_010544 [Tegillarca granosa]|uniref:Transcriptional coactivator p15 (PC4) C-terminal domain-containing protein n=1 Tax=Tegillarca granosa TaxID=220873 RepID=A0ABQ9F3C3_TEGGR|nr:hypothetical protein KUTeg_010544 [Tegillarca granosa]